MLGTNESHLVHAADPPPSEGKKKLLLLLLWKTAVGSPTAVDPFLTDSRLY